MAARFGGLKLCLTWASLSQSSGVSGERAAKSKREFSMNHLQEVIEKAWDSRDAWTAKDAEAEVREAVEHSIQLLDDGGVRVAERDESGTWITNEWLKKAVLLFFKLHDNQVINGGVSNYYDKVPLKFANWGEDMFRKAGIRVVPPAMVRKGSYIASKAVLMPSYVNIGAYVDEGTMVDTWSTVGSCAQIGKNVHRLRRCRHRRRAGAFAGHTDDY